MRNLRERQSQDGGEEQNVGQTFVTASCQGSPSSWLWEKVMMLLFDEKATNCMMGWSNSKVRKMCRHLLLSLNLLICCAKIIQQYLRDLGSIWRLQAPILLSQFLWMLVPQGKRAHWGAGHALTHNLRLLLLCLVYFGFTKKPVTVFLLN